MAGASCSCEYVLLPDYVVHALALGDAATTSVWLFERCSSESSADVVVEASTTGVILSGVRDPVKQDRRRKGPRDLHAVCARSARRPRAHPETSSIEVHVLARERVWTVPPRLAQRALALNRASARRVPAKFKGGRHPCPLWSFWQEFSIACGTYFSRRRRRSARCTVPKSAPRRERGRWATVVRRPKTPKTSLNSTARDLLFFRRDRTRAALLWLCADELGMSLDLETNKPRFRPSRGQSCATPRIARQRTPHKDPPP